MMYSKIGPTGEPFPPHPQILLARLEPLNFDGLLTLLFLLARGSTILKQLTILSVVCNSEDLGPIICYYLIMVSLLPSLT